MTAWQMRLALSVKRHHARTLDEASKRASAEAANRMKNLFVSHLSQYVWLCVYACVCAYLCYSSIVLVSHLSQCECLCQRVYCNDCVANAVSA